MLQIVNVLLCKMFLLGKHGPLHFILGTFHTKILEFLKRLPSLGTQCLLPELCKSLPASDLLLQWLLQTPMTGCHPQV